MWLGPTRAPSGGTNWLVCLIDSEISIEIGDWMGRLLQLFAIDCARLGVETNSCHFDQMFPSHRVVGQVNACNNSNNSSSSSSNNSNNNSNNNSGNKRGAAQLRRPYQLINLNRDSAINDCSYLSDCAWLDWIYKAQSMAQSALDWRMDALDPSSAQSIGWLISSIPGAVLIEYRLGIDWYLHVDVDGWRLMLPGLLVWWIYAASAIHLNWWASCGLVVDTILGRCWMRILGVCQPFEGWGHRSSDPLLYRLIAAPSITLFHGCFHMALWCSLIFYDALGCSGMLWDAPTCLWDALRGSRMLQHESKILWDALRCSEMLQHDSKMLWDALGCSNTSLRCSEMLWDAPTWLQYALGCSEMFEHVFGML